MPFNHYAKIKRILDSAGTGWYIKRIDEPTTAKTFKCEVKRFDHYYRIYDQMDNQIPYCKFQQMDLFAKTMKLSLEEIDTRTRQD